MDENGTRISVWNISSGKTGLPFQMFRCSRKFSVGKTQKVVFHLLSNRISRKILVNGKQPLFVSRSPCCRRRRWFCCHPEIVLPW